SLQNNGNVQGFPPRARLNIRACIPVEGRLPAPAGPSPLSLSEHCMRFSVLCSSLLTGMAAIVIAGVCVAEITSAPPATYLPPALSKATAVQRLLATDAPRRVVALPAPDAKERESLKSINSAPAVNDKLGAAAAATGKGRPLAVGYGRDIPAGDRVI